jgi:hypothetical protein
MTYPQIRLFDYSFPSFDYSLTGIPLFPHAESAKTRKLIVYAAFFASNLLQNWRSSFVQINVIRGSLFLSPFA